MQKNLDFYRKGDKIEVMLLAGDVLDVCDRGIVLEILEATKHPKVFGF